MFLGLTIRDPGGTTSLGLSGHIGTSGVRVRALGAGASCSHVCEVVVGWVSRHIGSERGGDGVRLSERYSGAQQIWLRSISSGGQFLRDDLGRRSVHISLMCSRHSAFGLASPMRCQPEGTGCDASQIEYCSSSLQTTKYADSSFSSSSFMSQPGGSGRSTPPGGSQRRLDGELPAERSSKD